MNDLTITRDVSYASGHRHSLDIYVPRPQGRARPVVVYFYGGGWKSGSKAYDAWIGAALARHGYVAVVADYRLYPQVHWPQFLEDSAGAVRWVHDHIAGYGGDPTALVLLGHSAGAFNAVNLAVDRRWLARVGMEPARALKAVIALSCPYMAPAMLDRGERAIFDVESGFRDPMDYVDGHSPALLFMVGDRDEVIDPHEDDQLIAKIRKKGGIADIIHYPSFGHDDTKNALAEPPGQTKAPVMDDISRFLATQGIKPPPFTRASAHDQAH
jgi:acetyl esterase/lipase